MGDFDCEFNAPMFVDFENMDDHNDHAAAEAYFEVNHEEIPEDVTPEVPEPAKEPEKVQKPPNIITSWNDYFNNKSRNGDQRPKPESKPGLNSSFKDTPTRSALRKAVSETIKDITNSPQLEIPEKRTISKESPVKRLQRAPISFKQEKTTPKASFRSTTTTQSPAMAKWRKAIKMMTPEVLKNARTANKLKTLNHDQGKNIGSEQARSFKSQLATSRRLASSKNTSKPAETITRNETTNILKSTNPEPFKFATDTRMKQSNGPIKSAEGSEVDFAKMLRSYQEHPANSKAHTGFCTKVQPFNMSGGAKARGRSAEPTPSRRKMPERSMAEQIMRMQTGTPDRFRSRPRWRSNSPNRRNRRSPSPGLTVGQSPCLMTRGRSRPTHVISHEEREKMELEEARQNQFKAKGVNEGLKPTKYPTIERKSCTKPQPFNFSSIPKRPVKDEEPSNEFHANPVNRRILQKTVGIPAIAPKSAVIPESPAFELKTRMAGRKRPAEDDERKVEEKRIVYAKPVPQYGVPVILPNASKKVTQMAPFSFNDRDVEGQRRKEEKIKQMLEDEQKGREFKAKPVPKSIVGPVNLPLKEVLEPTRAEPFSLEIERRVEDRLRKWEKSVKDDLKRQQEAANFRAKPATIFDKQPFIPQPSDKVPTSAEGFEFHSDRRALEREEFNERMRQKEAEMEALKQQKEIIKTREEEARIQQLRREAVHKAQPIKHFKAVHVLPSDRPITNPISPKWSYKEKKKGQLGDTFNVDK